MPRKPSAKKSAVPAKLIYWLLFAPFVLLPISAWIMNNTEYASATALWLGLILDLASVAGFGVGLVMLAIQPVKSAVFRSKKFSWPAMLLFLIPLFFLAASMLIYLPNFYYPGVDSSISIISIELLFLRALAVLSFIIGAVLALKRVKPVRTAWFMIGLAAIPYLLIIIDSFIFGGGYGFNTMDDFYKFLYWELAIDLSSIILGLVALLIGWLKFRHQRVA